MQIKKLEIKGFKSFADNTVIHFNEDVVGIVGSNGCGKSNIVDAIRWVLGEQKKSNLRSENNTAVIFNGTKSRKTASMAQVTLTFDNDKGILPIAFGEVSIKRSLYKDGTSEYFLNGVKCRLKDINNLLVDTGMGPDSYAIIALGMVDELLLDKDNSRLKLFEQAAGISKYKTRKKETFLKLKSTNADLERINDLAFEIEKNLKSLERQAKRAKTYYALKDEYKRLSLELSYFKIAECKASYKELNEQIKSESKRKKELAAELAALEQKQDGLKTDLIDKESRLKNIQRRMGQCQQQIRTKESDLKMLSQKTLFIQQNHVKLSDSMAQNRQKLEDIEQRLNGIESSIEISQQEADVANQQFELAKEMVKTDQDQIDELHASMKVITAQRDALEKAVQQSDKEMAVLQNELTTAESTVQQITERRQGREVELEQLSKELEENASKGTSLDDQIKKLIDFDTQRKESLSKLIEQIDEKQTSKYALDRNIDAKTNELTLLSSMLTNMEGFSQSIKYITQHGNWENPPVLISDIFHCDDQYKVALEMFLGERVGYFVTDTDRDAYTAIDTLKEHKKGKVNFIVLDRLPSYQKKKERVPDCVIDVLDYDDKYEDLAYFLFANVSIQTQSNQQNDRGYTIVQQDGSLLEEGARIFGGSTDLFEGKRLGRKKQVETLRAEIEQLQEKKKIIDDELSSMQDQKKSLADSDPSQQLRALYQEQNQFNQQRSVVQSRVKILQQQMSESEQLIDQKQLQIEQLRHQTTQLSNEKKDKTTSLQTKQTEELALKNKIDLLESQRREKSQQANTLQIEWLQKKNAVDSLSNQAKLYNDMRHDLSKQLNADVESMHSGGGDLDEIELEKKNLQDQLSEQFELKKQIQSEQTAAEKSFFAHRGLISETDSLQRKHSTAFHRSGELIIALEKKFNEVKLQLTTIAERLNVEFEIRINDLVNETPNPDFDEAVLESNVDQLRDRIQNFGTINPMAIEAYDEISLRHRTILEQRADLMEAQDNLMQTIQEIEDKATTKFMEAFERVRTHFKEVFRSLFHEDDTCDLTLSNPDKPLESRIEIVAQPKGKRPLSINQLSGGEKTLTATALLFSLYLLKPAPFCVFDEVDAPLDDANIAKFNSIIKDFSDQSQFIIVTHNKKTMSSVDIMYGVTMVEGVSRVVPVDFRSLEAV